MPPKQEFREEELIFKAPDVSVGEPGIVWLAHADRKGTPAPAMVNEVSNGVLTLTIFPKNGMPYCRSGVRHTQDPFLVTRQMVRMQSGGWQYCESTIKSRGKRAEGMMVPKAQPNPDAKSPVDEAAEKVAGK